MTIGSRKTWKETLSRWRADRQRVRDMVRARFGFTPIIVTLHPCALCMLFHRIAHYFWTNSLRGPARIVAQINQWITGFDCNPMSDIGPGALILHPTGSSISGHAERDLTMMGSSGLGFVPQEKDIGGGPGHPVLGSGILVGHKAGFLGPCRVGDNAHVQSACSCSIDVEPLSTVSCKATSTLTTSKPQESHPRPDMPPEQSAHPCPHARWRATWRDLQEDARRYLPDQTGRSRARSALKTIVVFTTIPMITGLIYRLSHYFHAKRLRGLARALCALNQLLNKVTIPPSTCVGGGLFLAHPVGTVLHTRAGRGLTLFARVVIAADEVPTNAPIDAAPVIADHVTLAAQSSVLGPVRIGAGARLGVTSAIKRHVPDSTLVFASSLRIEIQPGGVPAAVGVSSEEPGSSPRPALGPSWHNPAQAALPWHETRRRISEDRARRLVSGVSFFPAGLCALLHRWSHHACRRGHRRLAHFYWRCNLALTGVDIDPSSDLESGLLIPQPAGVCIDADAGRNLCVGALVVIGRSVEGIDVPLGSNQRPRLGNHVTLEAHAGVFGSIVIGDRVRVLGGANATIDLPDDSELAPPTQRFLKISSGEPPSRPRGTDS